MSDLIQFTRVSSSANVTLVQKEQLASSPVPWSYWRSLHSFIDGLSCQTAQAWRWGIKKKKRKKKKAWLGLYWLFELIVNQFELVQCQSGLKCSLCPFEWNQVTSFSTFLRAMILAMCLAACLIEQTSINLLHTYIINNGNYNDDVIVQTCNLLHFPI